MNILAYKGIWPQIDPLVFLAPDSTVIGDVVIREKSSIWFQTVVRGDVNYIRIGKRTNVQDTCVLHVTSDDFPLHIGDTITIGHHATVHGCTVGSNSLIGIGAIILDGAKIGESSLVAAGSLVTPGTEFPPGSLIMGAPAKVKKELSKEEREKIVWTAEHYIELADTYRKALQTAFI